MMTKIYLKQNSSGFGPVTLPTGLIWTCLGPTSASRPRRSALVGLFTSWASAKKTITDYKKKPGRICIWRSELGNKQAIDLLFSVNIKESSIQLKFWGRNNTDFFHRKFNQVVRRIEVKKVTEYKENTYVHYVRTLSTWTAAMISMQPTITRPFRSCPFYTSCCGSNECAQLLLRKQPLTQSQGCSQAFSEHTNHAHRHQNKVKQK